MVRFPFLFHLRRQQARHGTAGVARIAAVSEYQSSNKDNSEPKKNKELNPRCGKQGPCYCLFLAPCCSILQY